MEYQKIANLIDETPNQPSKFRTRNLVEINDESRGIYNVNSQIKFKTTMLKSSLCDYSGAYILVKGTISPNNTAGPGVGANNTNKKVIFKNCAPFTNCISEINNTQIDNAKDTDIVMPIYNLIEYSTTGCLLDYPYFIDTYKMIAVDLSRQKALDADPRAIQQINFTANLDMDGNTRVYFILEEANETILDFSQGTVKVL